MSGLFLDPLPREANSTIQDAIQLGSRFPAGIGRLSALTLISPITLFQQLYRKILRFLRFVISPENPITGYILMKTITKLRMPFFPSCIMDLGALASPERS